MGSFDTIADTSCNNFWNALIRGKTKQRAHVSQKHKSPLLFVISSWDVGSGSALLGVKGGKNLLILRK